MAKKSKIVREAQRKLLVERYSQRRSELKTVIASLEATHEDRIAAMRELGRQPRNASAVRLRNRDVIDGRPRGFIRKAGVSRIRFRVMAHRGELPGITKSSW